MKDTLLENFLLKNNFSVSEVSQIISDKLPPPLPTLSLPDFKLNCRPNASNGLWVLCLLPVAIIISSIKHPIVLTPTYKITTLASFALLCNSLYVIVKYLKNERLKVLNVWSISIALFTGCLLNICFHKGWIFSLMSGLFISLIFLTNFKFLLSNLRESFTLGEAGLISQCFTLFTYCSGLSVLTYSGENIPNSNMQISTVIIQMGLIGILSLSYLVYKLDIKTTKLFYFTSVLVLTTFVVLPLQVILKQNPVIWILSIIFNDMPLLKLFIYWSFCISLAVLAVNKQIFYAQKASTGTRKIFHILAVLVYVPGLYLKCSFLYLSSGVVLGVFFALEILRLLSLPPLGCQLQNGYIVFSDEKDSGLLALTPIYLLVGVSVPIWLHPSPCDVTDSAQFSILPLLSGLLTIGIGDTAASCIGSNYGKIKWNGTSKTIEGTLACISCQLGFIYYFYYLGYLPYLKIEDSVKILVSVIVTSLVEAKTTQIDNLVLPLLMYLFLI